MDREYAYGVDLIYNKEITKFWDTYVLASLYQQHLEFTDLESGLPVTNEGFSWFARANNNFTFLQDKSLTANLSMNWRAPLFFKNAEYDSYGSIDLSFRKSLWNKKASLTIGVDDIFNQGNIFSNRNFLTQSGTSFQRTENRLFSLAFRYKFGNSKIRSNTKRKRVDERNRL